MKYFGIIDKNVTAIFQLQWKIGNISDMFLQYSVLCGSYTVKTPESINQTPLCLSMYLRLLKFEIHPRRFESSKHRIIPKWQNHPLRHKTCKFLKTEKTVDVSKRGQQSGFYLIGLCHAAPGPGFRRSRETLLFFPQPIALTRLANYTFFFFCI